MTTLKQLDGSNNTLENYTYTYDHADRVTAETLNGSATTYAYDATNQLTTVITGAGTTTYSYDANGNRSSQTQTEMKSLLLPAKWGIAGMKEWLCSASAMFRLIKAS